MKTSLFAGVRVGFALATVALGGGLVYGYSALLPALADNTFTSLCAEGTRAPGKLCGNQRLRLALMYTLSTFGMSFLGPLWGWMLDKFGPRVSLRVGMTSSAVAMAVVGSRVNEWLTFVAFIVLGCVGPINYMSCFSLPKIVPSMTARINAWMTGAYDISALMFFLLVSMYQHTSVSFVSVTIGYGVLALVVGWTTSFLLPRPEELARIQQEYDQHFELGVALAPQEKNEVAPVEAERISMWPYVRETRFILATALICVMNLKNSYYITTFTMQMESLFTKTSERAIQTIYNIFFPLGGLMSTPLASILLHNFKDRDHIIFGTILVLALVQSAFNLTYNLECQYIAVFLFAFMRSLKWGAFNDFIAKHYPLQILGKMISFPNLFVALFGLFLYLAVWVTEHPLNGHVEWVIVFLTVLEGICLVVPGYMLWAYKNKVYKS